MSFSYRREPFVLLFGDIFFFTLALWLTLTIRYVAFPNTQLFYDHIIPFSLLFVAWLVIFFISGLYDKHTIVFKNKVSDVIFRAQIVNVLIAATFFFFIPYFGITPKTNLVIYLIVSFLLISIWRIYLFGYIRPRKRQKGVLIGSGKEVEELEKEVNGNSKYHVEFIKTIDQRKVSNPNDIQTELIEFVTSNNVTVIVANTKCGDQDLLLPLFYNLSFLEKNLTILDIGQLYEGIFDRVPISIIQYNWLIENVNKAPNRIYGILKRLMDISIASVLGIFSLILYPFVWIALTLEGGDGVFFIQERIGENNQPIKLIKFRTMTYAHGGVELDGEVENEVTKVGAFLRKTRIDELPQLWNVIGGSLSLIGPRPELLNAAKRYSERIPHYNVRHLVKPGLSGWAQIHHHEHPHHKVDIYETKEKLSYDLYYVKNRSLLLDINIALKTVRILAAFAGK